MVLIQRLDLREGIDSLAELAALQEQSNAIVIPTLPGRNSPLDDFYLFIDSRNGKRNRVFRQDRDRELIQIRFPWAVTAYRLVAWLGGTGHEVRELLVELAVIQFQRNRNRPRDVIGNIQGVMDHCRGTGRNLVIVDRYKNVLHIASRNAITVLVDHIDVDEVRPGIDFAVRVTSSTSSDHAIAAGNFDVQPDFVRIDCALCEEVSHFHGANDGLQ